MSDTPGFTSYRLLTLHEAHTKEYSAIVRSPFQFAQIAGPDYKPTCRCPAPWHQEFHGRVHAAVDDTKLNRLFNAALLLNEINQIFAVSGEMHNAHPNEKYEGEVVGDRYVATHAFVSSRSQERRLRSAYTGWDDLEISVVPDLYERLCYQRQLPQRTPRKQSIEL